LARSRPDRGSRRRVLPWRRALFTAASVGAFCVHTPAADAQAPERTAARITAAWTAAPIRDILRAFADFSGKSIVGGGEVTGVVTAYIRDRPWDVALRAILWAHGLTAEEDEYGILHVRGWTRARAGGTDEPVVTRAYRLSFAKASELAETLAPHLSELGRISVAERTRSLVVTDVESVHRTIGGLLP